MKALGLTIAIAAAAVVVPASAAKGPAYGELAVSQLGARPEAKTKPKSVPARESIPGLKPKVADKASVLAFDTTTGKPATKSSEIGGCVGVGSPTTTEWDGPVDAESHQSPTKGVIPVRAEKLVDNADGTAKLEITDAWFDTRSRGLRLIGKSTLALKPFATIPGGTRVLVGRDEHGGKKLAQFVVAEAKDLPAYLLAVDRNRVSRIGTESKTRLLGMCSHHRVEVAIGGVGSGESVSFELRAMLPALAPGEKSNVVNDLKPLSDWERKSGAKDVRMRGVRVQVGVSQTSRDKDPVLSVSTEWSTEEMIERVYTEREATFQAQRSFGLDSVSEPDDEESSNGVLF